MSAPKRQCGARWSLAAMILAGLPSGPAGAAVLMVSTNGQVLAPTGFVAQTFLAGTNVVLELTNGGRQVYIHSLGGGGGSLGWNDATNAAQSAVTVAPGSNVTVATNATAANITYTISASLVGGGASLQDVTNAVTVWGLTNDGALLVLTNYADTKQYGSAVLTNLAGTGAITNASWTNSYQPASANLTNWSSIATSWVSSVVAEATNNAPVTNWTVTRQPASAVLSNLVEASVLPSQTSVENLDAEYVEADAATIASLSSTEIILGGVSRSSWPSGGTASGLADLAQAATYWSMWDEFLAVPTATGPRFVPSGLVGAVSGTGATFTQIGSATNAPGVVRMETGSTATGRIGISAGTGSTYGLGTLAFKALTNLWRVQVLTTNDPDPTVSAAHFEAGVGNHASNTEASRGLVFCYLTNSTTWFFRSLSASGTTSINTDVTVGTDWETFIIESANTASSTNVRAIIVGKWTNTFGAAELGNSFFNGAPTSLGPGAMVRSYAGTASKQMHVDAVYLNVELLTPKRW